MNSDGSTTVANSGDGNDSSLPVTYSAVVTQAGTYQVTGDAYCPNNAGDAGDPKDDYSYGTFTVAAGLGGTITTSPDPVVVN